MYITFFWIRWSARELRRRWAQVAAIALVIAIGTGVYAGLSSTSAWARVSYDESYAALNTFDVRVMLPEGGSAPAGTLAGALADIEHPEWVTGSEERLIEPTQVEAAGPEETVLVPGRIVGVPGSGSGPRINSLYIMSGTGIADGAGTVLEGHFAKQYDLPPEGDIKLSGGIPVHYTGTGFTPEYFIVTTGQGDFVAQANFAVVFMPLEAAGQITGLPGQVNDLLITCPPDVDRNQLAAEVERAFAQNLPALGATVVTIEADPVHTILYRDLEANNSQNIAIAILVLLGAAFAAFNLTSRIVESQRREIGIGMALGVPRRTLALRPLLIGAEIAALGVVFGIGVGFLVGALLRSVFTGTFPLPVWKAPFQVGPFAGAAAIGFLLPFLATAWPVWRAVRVEPVQAIRTGHLAAKGGGLAPLLKRLRVPGKSLAQMPVRNVLRAPRRTILTALGIGATIVVLVAVLGILDSFNGMLDRIAKELGTGVPNRVDVTLAGYLPVDSLPVQGVENLPEVGSWDATLLLSASVSTNGEKLDLQLQALDLESPIWHPTIDSRVAPGDLPGIVLASLAAKEMGVEPGDTVVVTHPVRTGETTLGLQQTPMCLIGTHENPTRFLAFTDISNSGLFGLAGFTNRLQVTAAEGATPADVKQAVFNLPAVAFAQEPLTSVETTRDFLKQYTGVFQTVEGFALLLALLIAFNAASISVDERRREYATMESYGVRVKTLLRMNVVEAGIIGSLGTLVGIGLGIYAQGWLLKQSAGSIPDLQMVVTVKATTVVAALFMGIVATSLAPVFNTRKLRKMDVPSTLRVME